MKNYTITEDQIKKLSTQDQIVEEYLNEWFPEAFIPNLKLNTWYKWEGCLPIIGFLNRKTTEKHYAFEFTVEDICGNDHYNSLHFSNLELATEQEIRNALLKEINLRGYKKGTKIKAIEENFNSTYVLKNDKFNFYLHKNTVFFGEVLIFKKGIWAEIIKSKYLTKEQAENRLTELNNDGYEYEIID